MMSVPFYTIPSEEMSHSRLPDLDLDLTGFQRWNQVESYAVLVG